MGDLDPRVRIQHELIRVRRQAEAARLEANAARLEASAEHLEELIERIDAGEVLSDRELSQLGLSDGRLNSWSRVDPISDISSRRDESSPLEPIAPTPKVVRRFESWDAIRDARVAYAQRMRTGGGAGDSDALFRVDSAHHSVRAPRMQAALVVTEPSQAEHLDAKEPLESPGNDSEEVAAADSGAVNGAPVLPVPDGESVDAADDPKFAANDEPVAETATESQTEPPVAIVALTDEDETTTRRRHPMALVVSTAIHVLILVILAGFTLSNAMPKDQVALSASTSESSESAMETFEIEAVEPMDEPTETASDETQYDVSPLGEMAKVDVTSDVVAAVSQPMASMASLSQPNLNSSSALKALKSDSQSKMEFCGVEGGGNHFVYLVDSSGSMGDAFVSARRALLDSIEMLTPKQRFYVIFFDANCDYMRITRADQDEPRSVYATPENKSRLKAWAMRVSMDRGRAPYEPLEYALKTLKPDVIFLLSDGEFPAKIEDILKENNLVTNLFGDESPVSIIHTISYYSREGETRMRRIAEQNHGQYRHVPKPESR
ncbi:hypothetical protein Pla100_06990 [Neorhodopirellula pilleata]|uniref:VWFA domain-containing protein n=2 Tax=Neorhodopirellula pilleata TaxID=2714738 RepID=A0A5C6AX83_9BACT|nr:hypothetical protein Pla100_06990 [Neorhodopirellula pilleata]